jgi:ADP-ribose pyrophosphatase
MTRRVLFDGRVGSFGLDEVTLPSGRHVTLELLRHPGAAAVVPFLDDGRILLLHQYRYAAGGNIWEIPAGKLEAGEAPEVCAARELEEETGFRAGRLVRVGEILTSPGFTDERIHLFCAYDLTPGNTAHEPAEVIEVHKIPFDQAMDMITSGEIIDAKSIVALHHAARIRKD